MIIDPRAARRITGAVRGFENAQGVSATGTTLAVPQRRGPRRHRQPAPLPGAGEDESGTGTKKGQVRMMVSDTRKGWGNVIATA